MAEITLSKAVRSNLLNLQSTAAAMSVAQERLATGNKVNSALDNPSNFFTASALNSRAGDLGRLLDSVSNATQTIEAADNGISAITDLVESAQAAARQARQAAGQVTKSEVQGNDSTAVFAPKSTVSVAGTGAAVVARVEGTADVSALALNVAAPKSFTINGTVFDLEAADTAGNGDNTLSTAELGTYITAWNAANTAGTGSTVSIDASNHLTITQADESTNVLIANDIGGALANVGISAGTTTSRSTNLLEQGFDSGDTFTVSVGAVSKQITFGTAGGQVNTLDELQTELNGISNATITVADDGNITVAADSSDDAVEIDSDFTAGTGTADIGDLGLADGEYTNLVNGTAGPVRQGEVLSIGVAGSSALNITFGTGVGEVNTFEELEDKLATLAGGTATINSSTGAIDITATDSSKAITVSASNPGAGRTASDISAAFGLTNVTTASVTTDSTQRESLEDQFNELLGQINELAEDAGFNGVNLLNGDDLNVIFNEDGSSNLEIKGVSFNATGLGLSKAASGDFQSDNAIDNTLAALDTAIATLRSQGTKFGSNLSVVETRQNFTKEMINTLETGAANLTLADANEEAANLLALQTRQQLSSTALSLASQADQQVLRLF
jgi:flagellin